MDESPDPLFGTEPCFREGQAFENRETRNRKRRIRLVEKLTAHHWRALGIDTGRYSVVQTQTLLREYAPVDDDREPPSRPLPKRRAPGSDQGRPPLALRATIEVLLESAMHDDGAADLSEILDGLTRRGIKLASKSAANDLPGAKVIRRYMERLESEERVEVLRGGPREPWRYRLVDPEGEALAMRVLDERTVKQSD